MQAEMIDQGILQRLGSLEQGACFVLRIKRGVMADKNLKKLSRAELLEMMISFSEEAEAARAHETELREELEKEKLQLQREMAEERASMLKSFDEEKAEMRVKFNEQKAQMQAKFDKDISGLKARLAREKEEMQQQVDDALSKIENSQSLAEASIKLGGIMEAGQKAADLYVNTLKKNAETEYRALMKEIEESRQRIRIAEEQQIRRISGMTEIPEAAQEPKEPVEVTEPEKVEDVAEPENTQEIAEPKKKAAVKKTTVKKTTAKKTTAKTTTKTRAKKSEGTEEVVEAPKKRTRKKKDE